VTDALDRRAAILIAISGLAILFHGTAGSFPYEPATWKVALFIVSLAGFLATLSLAVLAVAPDHPRTARLPRREELLFWAAIAFGAALLLIAVVAGASAVDALGESPFDDFEPPPLEP
jgi:hypothetical protein